METLLVQTAEIPHPTPLQNYQVAFNKTGAMFADYYLTYVQSHQNDFSALSEEFDNLMRVRVWLAENQTPATAQQLLALIEMLTAYLRRPELAAELLVFCADALTACRVAMVNPGWVLLLRYEAYNYLGQWNEALADAQTALTVTRGTNPLRYAQAMLAKGRLQFNRGDYAVALATLAKAEALLTKVQDWNGVAAVWAQQAAYHLNRKELPQALALYQQVDALRQRMNADGPSDHTLLMFGVVYRELGDAKQATAYLQQLYQRGEAQGKMDVMATATHHLAWVYVQQANWIKARQLATRAYHWYLEIDDPRGASDAAEQLSVIARSQGRMDLALDWGHQALQMRIQLGNQQGMASCWRHLALAYLGKRQLWRGLGYLWRSGLLYWRLDILTPHRMGATARQVWHAVRRRPDQWPP